MKRLIKCANKKHICSLPYSGTEKTEKTFAKSVDSLYIRV